MILENEGLLNKTKYAKEGYSNAQKQEAIEIAKLTNQINGNIEGNRETITISKDEYDILKNANSYSTDEKVVGTWIDGTTPIYKKTFLGKLGSSGYDNIASLSDLNIQNVIEFNGTARMGR